MILATIFQNITEKLEKMTFCFNNFGGVIAAQSVICHPRLRKGVIKLQQIISKHKQAYIPTAIEQTITEKILKRTYFVLAILGVFVLSKLLYASYGCGKLL